MLMVGRPPNLFELVEEGLMISNEGTIEGLAAEDMLDDATEALEDDDDDGDDVTLLFFWKGVNDDRFLLRF